MASCGHVDVSCKRWSPAARCLFGATGGSAAGQWRRRCGTSGTRHRVVQHTHRRKRVRWSTSGALNSMWPHSRHSRMSCVTIATARAMTWTRGCSISSTRSRSPRIASRATKSFPVIAHPRATADVVAARKRRGEEVTDMQGRASMATEALSVHESARSRAGSEAGRRGLLPALGLRAYRHGGVSDLEWIMGTLPFPSKRGRTLLERRRASGAHAGTS